ncbi:MAG: glycoside hydrolase family 5 protein [Ruminococcus sp.]|nr:glycoside hydrolase family 5 protein [Ruminococcus sp.]
MTPYEKHGALNVSGRVLIDKNGSEIVLRGASTHGIAWYPQFVSTEAFLTLRDNWGCNCVRVALYTHEYHGYCMGGNKQELYRLVQKAIDAACELGLYIIVDWHVLSERDPMVYSEEAVRFFSQLSREYSDCGNVLYEICNEPNGPADWQCIRHYADLIIPVIRQHSPRAVILVGTPSWCQEVDKPLESPIECDNIMYSLHFYAATHKQPLRDRAEKALKAGLPVFIDEFNISDAYGSGAIDENEAGKWLELIEKYRLSAVCWSLCNSAESSSMIRSDCRKLSGWTRDDLSDSGKWMYDNIFLRGK